MFVCFFAQVYDQQERCNTFSFYAPVGESILAADPVMGRRVIESLRTHFADICEYIYCCLGEEDSILGLALFEQYESHFWHFLQLWPFEKDLSLSVAPGGDSLARLTAYFAMVLYLVRGTDKTESKRVVERGLEACELRGQNFVNPFGLALLSQVHGVLLLETGGSSTTTRGEAKKHLMTARALYTKVGSVLGQAIVEHALGKLVSREDGDSSTDTARTHFLQARELFVRAQHVIGERSCGSHLEPRHRFSGDFSSTPPDSLGHNSDRFFKKMEPLMLHERLGSNDWHFHWHGTEVSIHFQLPRPSEDALRGLRLGRLHNEITRRAWKFPPHAPVYVAPVTSTVSSFATAAGIAAMPLTSSAVAATLAASLQKLQLHEQPEQAVHQALMSHPSLLSPPPISSPSSGYSSGLKRPVSAKVVAAPANSTTGIAVVVGGRPTSPNPVSGPSAGKKSSKVMTMAAATAFAAAASAPVVRSRFATSTGAMAAQPKLTAKVEKPRPQDAESRRKPPVPRFSTSLAPPPGIYFV
jgi:hypothetical protein